MGKGTDFQLRPVVDDERVWRSTSYAAAPAVMHVLHEQRPLTASAESLFLALYGSARHAFWLDSSREMTGLAGWSFMGDATAGEVWRYRLDARCVEIESDERIVRSEPAQHGFLSWLRVRLAACHVDSSSLPFDFAGGFVGWLGYELKAECGGRAHHRSEQPDAAGLWVQRFVAIDHVERTVHFVALHAGDAQAVSARIWLDDTMRRAQDAQEVALPLPEPDGRTLEFSLEAGREQYEAAIARALTWIDAGDTYEVCLTNRVRGQLDVDPLLLYRRLRRVNPAPFAAFLKLDGLALLCSSPERFLRIDRSRNVEARPIKGTAPRSANPGLDRSLAADLADSVKDRAENLMIVDLLRNDLGRVCVTGSVRVPALMAIESYATVHQMVSVITGRLREGIHATDCIRAAFPGGSMTGAPKIHTMQIIDELEGSARGVYSGALGFVSLDGSADLNIVIRTMVLEDKRLTIGTGGAIVAGSNPRAEFDEMLLKARALLDAAALQVRGTLDDVPWRLAGAD